MTARDRETPSGGGDTGDLARFWGKSRGGVHPAICHLVDVGVVAEAIADRPAAAALRRLLAAPASQIGGWVALHDLGKISPGFQWKNAKLAELLREQGYDLPPAGVAVHAYETDHAQVTARALHRADPEWYFARALAAHHGSFPALGRTGQSLGNQAWAEAREAAVAAVAQAFELDPESFLPEVFTPAQAMALAGLTAVADWIGSDDQKFRRIGTLAEPLESYAARRRDEAREVLTQLGWDAWAPDGRTFTFEQLFAFRPNKLQEKVIALAEDLREPSCVVIETPMGSGKTEAALYLADVLLNRCSQAGIYLALPTQATSNAMFGRFWEYLELRTSGRPNLHLLHSLAAYHEDYAKLLRESPPPRPTEIEDDPTGLIAASWFCGAKLGLLSPFAVGTIDQALFGVLQTAHQFVRLYGLAGKVVILDEVHAYDTYTSTLLERLLEWLKVLGCSVIILSATLPAARRSALLEAWGAGAVAVGANYPRVTLVAGETVTEHEVKLCGQPKLRLAPLAPRGAWHQTARDHLAAQLIEGGCAAWLCNTVDRAQEAYLRLRDDPRFGDAAILLLHARYPTTWRQEREKQVKRLFGKPNPDGTSPDRPARAVVVATQVLEQSLDLDFDLMITDLAPMDLLLQRAGRVHRHRRTRPPRLQEAEVRWLDPAEPIAILEHIEQTAGVYDAWIVLQTWLALGRGTVVKSSAAIEALVEKVYGDINLPARERLAEEAAEAERRSREERCRQKGWAKANGIFGPGDEDPFWAERRIPGDEVVDPNLPSEALRAVTRLGEPSLMLVCAEGGVAGLDEADLVGLAVRVQHPGWFRHFRAAPVAAWQDSPVLRHYRLAELRHGRYQAEGRDLLLDEELGLVLTRHIQEMLR
ncbi:MAG: CRISPR-associated helicase Cas3' [Armatimonadetes bacterium]|nr:CRISPR-associated helicase Cas3' [Armatimonadota bacterium]